MSTVPIPRIERPGRAIIDDCIRANRPVVLTALTSPDTLPQWELPRLVAAIGERACSVASSPTKRYRYDARDGLRTETMTFADFSRKAFQTGGEGRYYYMQDDVRVFPPLMDVTRLPAEFDGIAFTQKKLWVSGAESITSLHYDPIETLLWQLQGSKRFVLFPPGVREYYPYGWRTKSSFLSQVSIDEPDYQQHPLFRRAVRHEVEVHPGDVIYIPLGWWHEVHSLGRINVSVNYRWFAPLRKTLKQWRQFLRTTPVILRSLRKIKRGPQPDQRGA